MNLSVKRRSCMSFTSASSAFPSRRDARLTVVTEWLITECTCDEAKPDDVNS